jgi:hypothetical protein
MVLLRKWLGAMMKMNWTQSYGARDNEEDISEAQYKHYQCLNCKRMLKLEGRRSSQEPVK